MPPRLNKRQQRELEELEALEKTAPEPSTERDEASSSEDELPRPTGASAFSTLLAIEGEEDESEEDAAKSSKSKKSKKKKKKPATSASETPRAETPVKASRTSTPVAPLPKNEKKALKKARAKEKKAADDELDAALKELSVQYPSLQNVASTSSTSSSSRIQPLAPLLATSLPHLDAEAELRKFFGSRVVTANKTSGSSPGARKKEQAKSNLTRPQGTWWPASMREGLTIQAETEEEVKETARRHGGSLEDLERGERWWTVEYSKKYKGVTSVFLKTVLSGDPQGFYDLLGKLPWHGDTLLQLSEIYRHREEHAQAVDFTDRALFTYERAFVGAFTFTTGMNRLDFDRVENRPFFLAVARQIADLNRRGCPRTAFEFARLLYSLDPYTDPHGSLLQLEFLAVKAGMGQWLKEVWDTFEAKRKTRDGADAKAKAGQHNKMDPSVLPGWAYARALALWMEEGGSSGHKASTETLKDAVMSFPSIVPLLADKLDVVLPESIRAHRDFRIETDGNSLSPELAALHLLSHLYALRSAPLWKEAGSWFSETISTLSPTLPSSLPATPRRMGFIALFSHITLRFSLYRHIIVLENTLKRLFAFIPRSVLDHNKSLACDPLPPQTAVNKYDEKFFEGTEDVFAIRRRTRTRREIEMDQRRLAQMVPDVGFRRQLEAFYNAHPNFAERFPGGIVQFAQMMAQLPPDAVEEMMLAEAMGAGDEVAAAMGMGGGDMPGGFGIGGMNGGNGGGWGDEPGPEEEEEEIEIPRRQHPAIAQDDTLDHAEDETEVGDDEDDEDEEAVSPMPRVIRNILGRFLGWNRPAEESSSDEEADDLGVD
ncbi:transcriptional repressor TCF25-domain-containing protein [Crucibulum laeve]|uniref:Transcriptional repressor TCF25-domain-containing protein n=1 Tax=Crucibulum laeve TaxID=68775 RepID=A0A5C3LM86_9AGAR|nr:transcriptional repressor TCF25-domain-containing protein [Crucibulum laeve]